MFQVGDLVKYDPDNKWQNSRSWTAGNENVGVVLEISKYKDDPINETTHVHVKWNNGEEKVYFAEELNIVSKKTPPEGGAALT